MYGVIFCLFVFVVCWEKKLLQEIKTTFFVNFYKL